MWLNKYKINDEYLIQQNMQKDKLTHKYINIICSSSFITS